MGPGYAPLTDVRKRERQPGRQPNSRSPSR
jgi:hypothetical protein